MLKGMVVLAALAFIAVPVLAGTYIMSDTEETAYGLRVMFSEPVTISAFGDALTKLDPTGQATKFTFSGGEVSASGGEWFNWEPASAKVVSSTWLKGPSTSGQLHSVETAEPSSDYEIALPSGESLHVKREMSGGRIPFDVTYLVAVPVGGEVSDLFWDWDNYVDTNGDGDPTNDHDAQGAVVSKWFDENYNPTVTLHVVGRDGATLVIWENMVRNDFLAGDRLTLDGEEILEQHGVSGQVAEVHWQQQHMGKMDLEYMTQYEAQIDNSEVLCARVIQKNPGKYVYRLTATLEQGTTVSFPVTAWVVENLATTKPTGFMMGDIWNDRYDGNCNCMADTATFFSDCQALAKLDWLAGEGFRDIKIANHLPLVKTYPMPEFSFSAQNGVDYIGNSDLAMVFDHIDRKHIHWGVWYFGNSSGRDANYWKEFSQLSRSYLESYWHQYREAVMSEAILAEKMGLVSFLIGFQDPYTWGLWQLEHSNPSNAEWLAEQWISLFDSIRDVFSGEVGWGVPGDCSVSSRIVPHVDFLDVCIGNFHGETAALKRASTIEELRKAYSQYIDSALEPLWQRYRKPLRFTFWAYSFENGSRTGWVPEMEEDTYATWEPKFAWEDHSEAILSGKTNPEYVPDFRDQVTMIEALMPELAKRRYIEAIFSEFEYWKLLDFDHFMPANIVDYFNVFTGSLQGKPAFEAYRLWASMLSPTKRLLYRRVIPPDLHAVAKYGDQQLAKRLQCSWDNAPLVASLSLPIDKSFRWSLPGHQVKSVRIQLTESVLAVQWEGYGNDLRSAFYYTLRFYPPGRSDITFFITARPRDAFIQLNMAMPGKWLILPVDRVGFEIDDNHITIYLPGDMTLPTGDTVADLGSWTIAGFLEFPAPGHHALYRLFGGSSYNQIAEQSQTH